MDPVTAFSIACGIMQVADFGFKATRKVWMIANSSSGASVDYVELETATSTLVRLMNALKSGNDYMNIHCSTTILQDPGDAVSSSTTAHEIRKVALQCEETATKLINLIKNIKADPKRYKSTVSRTLKAIKGIPKYKKISKLELQLEEYQKQLEKHILIELRQTSRALLDGTIGGFEDLQTEQKVIVAAIANNETNIARLITAEGDMTRKEIVAVEKKLDDLGDKQKVESFIKSFAFEDMFQREDRMGQQPAAPRTFRWIFDEYDSNERPYNSFMEWLEGDETIYWISGKAGSGKSTLLSFIWDHPDSRKNEYLRKWSASNELLTAAVFFWSQGSHLQKSSEGLLRSLLYQIFQQNGTLAYKIMTQQNHPQGPNRFWTEARLLLLLLSVLGEADIRVCFFIDGLDEYGDGDIVTNNSLLSIVFKLIEHANGRLKCCLSSRPLRPFELGLEKYPKLMLHNLNRPDITHYVEDSLGDAGSDFLAKSIVQKANGVFLWAFFAVKSLQTAQINGDTSDQVRQRLNELPSELNDLYSHMLHKID